MKKVFVLLVVAGLIVPVFGQCNCDFNNDGLDGFPSDLVSLVAHYNLSPDIFSACGAHCNADGDADSMTIADINALLYYMMMPNQDVPQYGFNPTLDTLKFSPAWGMPGQRLSVPLYFSTVDTIMGFEILAKVDDAYMTISDFIPADDLNFYMTRSEQRLHLYQFASQPNRDPELIMPGNYMLGELVVDVSVDIDQPVTTSIEFRSCPDDNFYTGLANNTFFRPVMVDGSVTITPTSIDDDPIALPTEAAISAYPNPFNLSTTISVEGINRGDVRIYNVSGQLVDRLLFGSGDSQASHSIIWEATDSKGRALPTGIYFAVVNDGRSQKITKLNLIK